MTVSKTVVMVKTDFKLYCRSLSTVFRNAVRIDQKQVVYSSFCYGSLFKTNYSYSNSYSPMSIRTWMNWWLWSDQHRLGSLRSLWSPSPSHTRHLEQLSLFWINRILQRERADSL